MRRLYKQALPTAMSTHQNPSQGESTTHPSHASPQDRQLDDEPQYVPAKQPKTFARDQSTLSAGVGGNGKNKGNCRYCGIPGHWAKECCKK
jgi:hypothetical protein